MPNLLLVGFCLGWAVGAFLRGYRKATAVRRSSVVYQSAGPSREERRAEMTALVTMASENLARQIRAAAPIPGEFEWNGFIKSGERIHVQLQVTIAYDDEVAR